MPNPNIKDWFANARRTLLAAPSKGTADSNQARDYGSILRVATREIAEEIPHFVIDHFHTVHHWSSALESRTGVAAETIIGTTNAWAGFYCFKRPTLADLVVDGLARDGMDKYYSHFLRQQSSLPDTWQTIEFVSRTLEGGGWVSINAKIIRDDTQKIIGAVEIVHALSRAAVDAIIPDHKKLAYKMPGSLALRDFENALRSHWQKAVERRESISILYLGIDQQPLNRRLQPNLYPHYVELVANAIRQEIGEIGQFANFGNDKVAILLPKQGHVFAYAIAENIRTATISTGLQDSMLGPQTPTVSIGVASAMPDPTSGIKSLLDGADSALVRARLAGGNIVTTSGRVESDCSISPPLVRSSRGG